MSDIVAQLRSAALSPALALMHLLIRHGSAASVDAVLAAAEAAGGEGARHLAAARRLLADTPTAEQAVATMLAGGPDHALAGGSGAVVAALRQAFDRAAVSVPEASVALYSLGSAAILEAATDEIVALLDRWRVPLDGRRILDLGCGIGRVAAALAARGALVVGTDIAVAMLREARRRVSKASFVQGAGTDLACFAERHFDLVLAVDTFPYLVQANLAERHIAEAARLLRPGGELVVLNWSYRGDPALDRREAAALAAANELRPLVLGARELSLWDAPSFRLAR